MKGALTYIINQLNKILIKSYIGLGKKFPKPQAQ